MLDSPEAEAEVLLVPEREPQDAQAHHVPVIERRDADGVVMRRVREHAFEKVGVPRLDGEGSFHEQPRDAPGLHDGRDALAGTTSSGTSLTGSPTCAPEPPAPGASATGRACACADAFAHDEGRTPLHLHEDPSHVLPNDADGRHLRAGEEQEHGEEGLEAQRARPVKHAPDGEEDARRKPDGRRWPGRTETRTAASPC